jgi:hypothetical protein
MMLCTDAHAVNQAEQQHSGTAAAEPSTGLEAAVLVLPEGWGVLKKALHVPCA